VLFKIKVQDTKRTSLYVGDNLEIKAPQKYGAFFVCLKYEYLS
tara:strand:- start:1457 stop:1585 length:129 start_codon:yes stop_codon:yes gene_type:complete